MPRTSILRSAPLAWTLVVLVVLLAVAVITLAVPYVRGARVDLRAYRASIILPPGIDTSVASPARRFAISPDGTRLAFVARGADGRTLLWVRPLDGLTAQPLAGTEGAMNPFWSPDGRFLGFNADARLKKINVSGGPPLTLVDADAAFATWNRNDVIVFSRGPESLQRVSAAGGTPSRVTTLDPTRGEAGHIAPFFLPDGRHFLYLGLGGSGTTTTTVRDTVIYVGSLDPAEKPRVLLSGGANAQYAQGHLLFLRDTTLMAQPFDASRLELTGEAVPLAEQVEIGGPTGVAGAFSVAESGTLAYQIAAGEALSRLTWVDRHGKTLGLLGDPGTYGEFELSPDGKRAAISVLDAAKRASGVWLFDVVRGVRTRFTLDVEHTSPVWSPDGTWVVFNSRRKGPLDLYRKAASGAGDEDVLLADRSNKVPRSWAPDGRFITYDTGGGGTTRTDLWVLPLVGDQKPFALVQTPFVEGDGRFSPDGRWIAYTSDESGRREVYVSAFPGTASGRSRPAAA